MKIPLAIERTINYQLSIINYQLSIINYQLSIINLTKVVRSYFMNMYNQYLSFLSVFLSEQTTSIKIK